MTTDKCMASAPANESELQFVVTECVHAIEELAHTVEDRDGRPLSCSEVYRLTKAMRGLRANSHKLFPAVVELIEEATGNSREDIIADILGDSASAARDDGRDSKPIKRPAIAGPAER